MVKKEVTLLIEIIIIRAIMLVFSVKMKSSIF